MYLCYVTRARGWNRPHGFLGLQLHETLVLLDRLAFGDQDSDHRAALDTFCELGKFYVHEESAEVVGLGCLAVKGEGLIRIDTELANRFFDDLRWKGLF